MTNLKSGLNAAMAGEPLESLTFTLPWTARAFAIMLAASKAGHFSLSSFQASLIDTIAAAETEGQPIKTEEDYYTCWIIALTKLLKAEDKFSDQQLNVAEDKVRKRLVAIEHEHNHSDHHNHDHNSPKPVYRECN